MDLQLLDLFDKYTNKWKIIYFHDDPNGEKHKKISRIFSTNSSLSPIKVIDPTKTRKTKTICCERVF